MNSPTMLQGSNYSSEQATSMMKTISYKLSVIETGVFYHFYASFYMNVVFIVYVRRSIVLYETE